MPFEGPEGQTFDDFDHCVRTLAEDGDMSEEDAKEICGKWQSETKDEMTESLRPKRGAFASGSEGDGFVVHGVAIGEDDITLGTGTETFKQWPREALEPATDTLVGADIVKNHDDKDIDQLIGKVTDAKYETGRGVLFQGTITDEQVASKVSRGWLDVSPKVRIASQEKRDDGVFEVEDVHSFANLGVVVDGASPSNEINAGENESMMAVESLQSAFDYEDETVDEILDSPSASEAEESEDMGSEDNETPEEELREAAEAIAEERDISAEEVLQSLEETGEETQENGAEEEEETTESPEEDGRFNFETMANDEDFDRLEAEIKLADESVEELTVVPRDEKEEYEKLSDQLSEKEDEVEELEEEIDELKTEQEDLEEEVEDVKSVYAEELSEMKEMDKESFMDRFEVSELRELYEEAVGSEDEDGDVDDLTGDSPDPNSGDDPEGEANSGSNLSDDEREELEELEQKVELLEEKNDAVAQAALEVHQERIDEIKED